ncbi:MAG: DUF2283 domain-containing protein, partial [Patescibacteria group bacterium]
IRYDKEVDALYVEFKKDKITRTVEGRESFLIDLNKKGEVVGFEVLDYSKAVSEKKDNLSVFIGRERIRIPA